jgi:hypothetical protein
MHLRRWLAELAGCALKCLHLKRLAPFKRSSVTDLSLIGIGHDGDDLLRVD